MILEFPADKFTFSIYSIFYRFLLSKKKKGMSISFMSYLLQNNFPAL